MSLSTNAVEPRPSIGETSIRRLTTITSKLSSLRDRMADKVKPILSDPSDNLQGTVGPPVSPYPDYFAQMRSECDAIENYIDSMNDILARVEL